jgi:hypothetical protein
MQLTNTTDKELTFDIIGSVVTIPPKSTVTITDEQSALVRLCKNFVQAIVERKVIAQ